jgi:hypothetical protein
VTTLATVPHDFEAEVEAGGNAAAAQDRGGGKRAVEATFVKPPKNGNTDNSLYAPEDRISDRQGRSGDRRDGRQQAAGIGPLEKQADAPPSSPQSGQGVADEAAVSGWGGSP